MGTYLIALSFSAGSASPELIHFFNTYHFPMMNDEARAYAYRDALLRSIRPGDTVLEIGTGGGLLAMMAGRIVQDRGGHVYSVEGAPGLAELAREVVTLNKLSEHVTVIANFSTSLRLEQMKFRRADVLFSETLGTHLLEEGQLNWIADARGRLTTDAVRIIPGSARQYITLVESQPWLTHPVEGVEVQEHLPKGFVHSARCIGGDLTAPVVALEVDFYKHSVMDLPLPRTRLTKRVKVLRDGTLHGAYSHFDTFEQGSYEGLMMSTHPAQQSLPRQMAWGLLYAALPRPLTVHRGEALALILEYHTGGKYEIVSVSRATE